MVKRNTRKRTRLTAAAEVAGRSLGHAAGAIDSLTALHPHPVAEIHEVLTAGRKNLTTLTSRVSARSTDVVKKTKAAARKTRAALARARRRAAKAVTALSRSSEKAVKQAGTAAARARKAASRSVQMAPAFDPDGRSSHGKSNPRTASRLARLAAARRLETAHMKRREAHSSSRGRRQQARRDKKR